MLRVSRLNKILGINENTKLDKQQGKKLNYDGLEMELSRNGKVATDNNNNNNPRKCSTKKGQTKSNSEEVV